MDSSAKVVGPRLLHSSQYGIIDPVDTPDGGNIGLHKHMAITTYVTNGFSSYPMLDWLRLNVNMKLLEECGLDYLNTITKDFIWNMGRWY